MACSDPIRLAAALGEELAILDSPAAKKVIEFVENDLWRPKSRRRLTLMLENTDGAPTVYTDGGYTFTIINGTAAGAAGAHRDKTIGASRHMVAWSVLYSLIGALTHAPALESCTWITITGKARPRHRSRRRRRRPR